MRFIDLDGLQVRPPSRGGYGSGGTHGGAGGTYGQVISNGYTMPSGRYVPPGIPLGDGSHRPNLQQPPFPIRKLDPVGYSGMTGSREQEFLRQLMDLYDAIFEDHIKEKIRCELNPLACLLESIEEKTQYCPAGS
ncbi:hypothetical protein [Cellvibrio polysaccharolyticus]|uniref:hypothetical protein n=1 Tax=Cellvibrio polysaccharolyticus TaxID=2082724 RepID=UPI001F1B0338|nr:hypothetical protein [Cellvibrio polysaccharolyticus]